MTCAQGLLRLLWGGLKLECYGTEYRDKKKLYMCFVDIEMALDKTSNKGDGVDNEKERFTRSNCKSGDQPLSRGKSESSNGI